MTTPGLERRPSDIKTSAPPLHQESTMNHTYRMQSSILGSFTCGIFSLKRLNLTELMRNKMHHNSKSLIHDGTHSSSTNHHSSRSCRKGNFARATAVNLRSANVIFSTLYLGRSDVTYALTHSGLMKKFCNVVGNFIP